MAQVQEIITNISLILIYFIESIGILIIAYSAIKTFLRYCQLRFKEPGGELKLMLAHGMTLGLEFLLAGEILKTIVARDITELLAVGGLVIIRALITLLLHWELKNGN